MAPQDPLCEGAAPSALDELPTDVADGDSLLCGVIEGLVARTRRGIEDPLGNGTGLALSLLFSASDADLFV